MRTGASATGGARADRWSQAEPRGPQARLRLGKGFRGPPRDAWLSSLADPAMRGYSFGVHKALDKAGAVFGPLMAYGLLRWLGESASAYRTLFLVAFVPAALSIVMLVMMKDQPGERH